MNLVKLPSLNGSTGYWLSFDANSKRRSSPAAGDSLLEVFDDDEEDDDDEDDEEEEVVDAVLGADLLFRLDSVSVEQLRTSTNNRSVCKVFILARFLSYTEFWYVFDAKLCKEKRMECKNTCFRRSIMVHECRVPSGTQNSGEICAHIITINFNY